jgi:GTP-binding protein Era
MDELKKVLQEGPKYFPDDMVTDQPERLLVAEIVREKLLGLTRDEIPHAIAVYTEEMAKRGKNKVFIRVTVYVERDSQKRIVIGKNGTILKAVGQRARTEIENLLGSDVFLDIWVKVRRDWRNQASALNEFGYKNE